METNKILNSNLLDIIFDGKNKMYGAYDLRNTYNNRLSKSLFITSSLAVLIFAGTVFASKAGNVIEDTFTVADTVMVDASSKPVPLPPQPPKATPVANQKKFLIPLIVTDPKAQTEQLTELTEEEAISSVTIKSDVKAEIGIIPIDEPRTQVFEEPKAKGEDTVFQKVEIEAEFPGGALQWSRYLQKNLNAGTPVNNGAPGGTYQVRIRFIVSKEGAISDVHSEKKYGYGMEEEAIKIIKQGPKWKPALQNGRNVDAYRSQPITFVVEE